MIRYLKINNGLLPDTEIYEILTDEFSLSMHRNGEFGTLLRTYGTERFSLNRRDIIPPDPGPIEERYINATDRPSVQGFKHPELQPLSNVVGSIYEIRVRPKHTTKNCTIGSKVRLYDGREGK